MWLPMIERIRTDYMAKVSEQALATVKKTQGTGPQIKRHVSRSQIKQKLGETVWLKILGPIYQSKQNAAPDAKKPDKAPPMLANVLNLHEVEKDVNQTNGPWREYSFIIPVVLKSELEAAYPDNKYVDLCFMITKTSAANTDGSGKRYSTFEIAETFPPG
jgi:hypothetical protein